jgi:glucose/arabinose dehydrogenase/PKD repeat protein
VAGPGFRPLTIVAVLALCAIAALADTAQAITLPEGFDTRTRLSGMTAPVAATWAPDGRVFIAEKRGKVLVARPGETEPRTLLDIREHVNDFQDWGLLGLAVDADFATNGYLYLLYTYDRNQSTADEEVPLTSRLTRVQVNADDAVVNPSSPERVLLGSVSDPNCPTDNEVDCIPASDGVHAIGTVRSDPDGTLWVGAGDGTRNKTLDSAFRAQSKQSLAGKILHIDRDGRGLAGHPFCPTNTDLDDVCTKVYASGFRNPYRFTLREGRGPAVGDVGRGVAEELNLVKPGLNYGWPCYEGTTKMVGYKDTSTCQKLYSSGAAKKPAYQYPNPSGGGAAIVGGPTYLGPRYPEMYNGELFIADYVQGFIRAIKLASPTSVESVHGFASSAGPLVDLELAPNGNLAYIDPGGFGAGEGRLREIVFDGNSAPVARASATPTSGPAPLTVQFRGSDSSDSDGDELTYEWDFGDGSAHSSEPDPEHTYQDPGVYTARLRVTDPQGEAATESVRIQVGNPPQATITAPADGALYRGGEQVQLQGSATDPEDGQLGDSALSWKVLLHHGSHLHEFQTLTGASPTFTPNDDHDADSFYEVTLTATDSEGLTGTQTITLRPATVRFSLDTSPRGGNVSYDTTKAPPRLTVTSAVGYRATVSTVRDFKRDGKLYVFKRWSDGGARTHEVTIPNEDQTLTATYGSP